MITVLFTLASGLNAFLLFSLQPLIAKSILPYFGGSPAVWSTCLVFFQTMLLLGYLGAFALGRIKNFLLMAGIPALLFLSVCLFKKVDTTLLGTTGIEVSSDPIYSLSTLLLFSCGLQALLLSGGSPFQQALFARMAPHTNPFRLYAASNYGSLLGLVSYPLFIEPFFPLKEQLQLWQGAFLTIACLLICIAVYGIVSPQKPLEHHVLPEERTHVKLQWDWFLIPGISSALLISISSYISTDVAPVPLLWIIPFAAFLISYAVPFGGSTIGSSESVQMGTRIMAVVTLICWLSGAREPWILVTPIFFISFTLLCLSLHDRLYSLRPPAAHLTTFYVSLAFGGCIGGLFVSCIAPHIFTSTIEPPVLLALGLIASSSDITHTKSMKRGILILVALLTTCVAYHYKRAFDLGISEQLFWVLPVVAAYGFSRSSRVVGMRLLVVVLLGILIKNFYSVEILSSRNFFGTLAVVDDKNGIRSLVHGVTVHGSQRQNPGKSCNPSAYYHPSGPAGTLLKQASTLSSVGHIGIIGLGTGALACYATAEQPVTFFEINPEVVRIASTPSLFSFLENSKAPITTVLGDARLSLQSVEKGQYDLLVIDAFSSDSIPTHLLTHEAFNEYLRVMPDTGVLLIHISNKFLDLTPVITGAAESHHLVLRRWIDLHGTPHEIEEGKLSSYWVVLARNESALSMLTQEGKWEPIKNVPPIFWTDQFSSITKIFHPF